MDEDTNPFQISFAKNDVMGAWDVMMLVGNLKTEEEAKRFAELLSEWMIEESGWKARVQ